MSIPGSPRQRVSEPRRPHRARERPLAAAILVLAAVLVGATTGAAAQPSPGEGPARGNNAPVASPEARPEAPAPAPANPPAPDDPATARRPADADALERLDEAPRDPDDTPFMDPPNGQPSIRAVATTPDLVPRHSLRRRVQLTAVPLYAAIKLPMIGRPDATLHGAGGLISLDLQLHSWISLRLFGAHTVHPVDEVEVFDEDSEMVQRLANPGLLQATTFGASAVLGLDIGRFLPLVDLGLGGLRLSYPEGVAAGQQGAPCASDGVCDIGLRCSAEAVCVPSIIGDLHAGVGADVLLRKHLTIGAEFRYHALLTAPGTFPIYLTFGARVAARW